MYWRAALSKKRRRFGRCSPICGSIGLNAINEYAIATEALGRNRLFDARIDATVRVQISRLRQRLDRFYEEEGKDCKERLTIPLGSHHVQLECVGTAQGYSLSRPDRGRSA